MEWLVWTRCRCSVYRSAQFSYTTSQPHGPVAGAEGKGGPKRTSSYNRMLQADPHRTPHIQVQLRSVRLPIGSQCPAQNDSLTRASIGCPGWPTSGSGCFKRRSSRWPSSEQSVANDDEAGARPAHTTARRTRRDIADLLVKGRVETARLRVETLISEDIQVGPAPWWVIRAAQS